MKSQKHGFSFRFGNFPVSDSQTSSRELCHSSRAPRISREVCVIVIVIGHADSERASAYDCQNVTAVKGHLFALQFYIYFASSFRFHEFFFHIQLILCFVGLIPETLRSGSALIH